MPPKFQSTFIPTGPAAAATTSAGSMKVVRTKHRSLFSFIAGSIFTLSVLLALGVFGYKYFLNYRIEEMGAELESARAAIDPGTVLELIKLNYRIVSTQSLINNHLIISPIFEFLETSTPESVRYSEFNFSTTPQGLILQMRGQAESYGALAAASEVYNRSELNFKNPTFSELQLDAQGNVVFALQLEVEDPFLSYAEMIKDLAPTFVSPSATSTPASATSSTSALPGGTSNQP